MDIDELHQDKQRNERLKRHIFERWAVGEPQNIACVVGPGYVFDFLVFYYSLVDSWTFYPYRVHVFCDEEAIAAQLRDFGLPHVDVHPMPTTEESWRARAASKVLLVEHSGLESCLVTDVDVLFLGEMPELGAYLETHDFVFIGCPDPRWVIQTSLWGFRRSKKSLLFARHWYKQSVQRSKSDASGLPFALESFRDDEQLRIKALVREREENSPHRPSPYNVQANVRPLALERDELGFHEPAMGRAKVLHFGGIRGRGTSSVARRMQVMASKFPESKAVFELYLRYANIAAGHLGLETLADWRDCLDVDNAKASHPSSTSVGHA